ncbi:MAG TPA: hypothetical protein GXX25_07930 [Desulfotomaculum sp.]|nr:hypothetical protein [Desulfotomaculum sp.]
MARKELPEFKGDRIADFAGEEEERGFWDSIPSILIVSIIPAVLIIRTGHARTGDVQLALVSGF